MAESEGFLRVLSPAQKCQSLPLQLPLISSIGTSENCFSSEFSHPVLDFSYTKKSVKLLSRNQQFILKQCYEPCPFFPWQENLPVLAEEITNRRKIRFSARYLEVGRAILQDF